MASTENESVDPQAWLLEQASLRDVLAEVTATWGDSRLAIRYYLGDSPPPSSLVTSVRAVLFHERTVMVVQDSAQAYHVMPGGRREPGETIEATLRREILEETGWTVASHHPLGFAHFRHLTPQPADYPYPYPDFVQLLFVAEAGEQVADAQQGEYELSAVFRPVDEALGLLTGEQAALLESALRVREGQRQLRKRS
jgi:8-oxo-dGTP pyrophosphatase MutT (NUDIX family)